MVLPSWLVANWLDIDVHSDVESVSFILSKHTQS